MPHTSEEREYAIELQLRRVIDEFESRRLGLGQRLHSRTLGLGDGLESNKAQYHVSMRVSGTAPPLDVSLPKCSPLTYALIRGPLGGP